MELADTGSDEASHESFDFDTNAKVGAEVNITKDGGVVKKILVEGSGWRTPEKGDSVAVHYVGTLEDGTKFDSSRDRGEPFNFTLGEGRVIKGWDAGVETMKKGEKAILTCKPEYAYGSNGSPPTIPPNATLNFEVELMHWRSVSDLSGDGGVIKNTVTEGSGYDNPKDRDVVLVKYTAKIKDTEMIFASTPEEGVEFVFKNGHLCKGFGVAIAEMKKGEQANLVIAPQYAVPPGETVDDPTSLSGLEIDVTLVSWMKVEDISDDGLIVKKTLNSVEGWERPKEDASVKIRYTAKLEDGTIFEERLEGNELEFILDEEQVIEGLDKAILKMRKGEIAEVSIASKYAFVVETQMEKAVVPAGANVIYEVELVDLTNPKPIHELTVPEKIERARENKEKGNKAYKEGKFIRAISKYEAALGPLEYDKEFETDRLRESKDMKRIIWLNLAAVSLKTKEYNETISNCRKVLEVDPTNIKAHFRRSQAHMYQSDFVEAEQAIKLAINLEPNNKDILAYYRKLKQAMRSADKRDAALYSTMFKELAKVKEPDQQETKGAEGESETAMEAGPSGE